MSREPELSKPTLRPPQATTHDMHDFERMIVRAARFAGVRWDRVGTEIDIALEEILGFCSIDRVGICEVLPDQSEAHLRHVACAAHVMPLPNRFSYGELFPWLYRNRILRGEALALSSLDELPPHAPADKASLQALGVQSVLDIPLRVDGDVRFIVSAACHHEPYRWTPHSIARLCALGEIFANALARAKAVGAMLTGQHDMHDVESSVHLGRWEWDLGADRIHLSEQARRIFGADLPELSALIDLVAPADREKLVRAVAHARAEPGERVAVCYTIRTADGEERVIHQWHEVLFPGERTARLFAAVHDVTDSLKAEAEVLELRSHHWHSARVAQTGLLVASLAHELTQPLAAILSNAQAGLRFLSSNNVDPQEMHELLTDIVASNRRAGEVLGALRAMLRRQRTTRVTFEAAEAVNDVLALVRSELMSEQIDVETSLDSGVCLKADKTQIEQVLLNLVVNAIHAMRGVPAEQRSLRIAVLCSGPDVRFSVADSGAGMPADKLAKVFEAFWTTKKKGLGMGLSICRSIVDSYGGRIWFETNAKPGVTFHFTLPAVEEPQSTPRTAHEMLR